jgi:predicted MFS family arabinose efflux permease
VGFGLLHCPLTRMDSALMTTPLTTIALPREFNRLAWSNLAAQSAEQVGLAAAPIVAVLALGAGAGETGLLQTAQTLPYLLLSLPAGVLADRMSRRTLMVFAEALRAVSLAGILLMVQSGHLSLLMLAVLGFAGACGTVVYSVVAPALVPALVPSSALAAANARIELARTVAFAGGPAVAGGLVGWGGASPAFAFACALSVGAVFLLMRLVEPERPRMAQARSPLREVREGAAFVFTHPLLMPVFITQVVFNTAFLMLQAVYVPYAINTLGLSAGSVGATLAALGAGMVIGALLATSLARRLSFGTMVAIGPVAGVCSALAMLLTLWVPSAWLAGISFFLIGAGPVLWVISTGTLRQSVTPPHLLGRVSAMFTLAQGSRPLGALLGAFIGGVYGIEACLVAIVAGFAVQAAVILASPVVRLGLQPQMAAQ